MWQRGLLVCILLLAPSCGGESPTPYRSERPPVVLSVRAAAGGAARLIEPPEETTPDFVQGEKRAWRVARLFGRAWQEGPATLEVELDLDGQRQAALVDPIRETEQGVWIVRWNRKGQIVLDRVDPADPFPLQHGRGGNRGRGSGVKRGVVALRLVQGGTAGADALPPGAEGLLVVVDGKAQPFSPADLAGLETLDVVGDSGQGTREAWSLRELARAVGGAGARITTLRGAGGRELALAAEDWARTDRMPILRRNRRGAFKFHWSDREGRPVEGPELRNVTTLVLGR